MRWLSGSPRVSHRTKPDVPVAARRADASGGVAFWKDGGGVAIARAQLPQGTVEHGHGGLAERAAEQRDRAARLDGLALAVVADRHDREAAPLLEAQQGERLRGA